MLTHQEYSQCAAICRQHANNWPAGKRGKKFQLPDGLSLHLYTKRNGEKMAITIICSGRRNILDVDAILRPVDAPAPEPLPI